MSKLPGKRAFQNLLCLLMAALVLAGSVPAGFAADNRSRIKELQQKTQSVKARAAEMRRKKYEKMRAAQKVNMNIVANQIKLDRERRSLHFHENRLDQTKDKLVYLDNRLDRTMGDAMRLGQDAGQRMRSLYMGERLSMLQMIMEANDLSTLLDRIYYKKQIMAQDKLMLDTLRQKIQELNSLKSELARQKSIIGQTIATIRVKNMEIQRSIAVDRALRDRYRNDAAFYERAENELLAESASITSQIRALTSRRSFRQVRNSTGSFIWPIGGAISSGFGTRYHPIHKRTKMHTGLDIAGPNGGAVKAADGGQVIWAGWKGGYGKTIMINHGTKNGRNLVTLYGHLSRISVSSGQSVSKGQVIGAEGSTGYSTGPHLHFEVRVNGAPVNPLGYL